MFAGFVRKNLLLLLVALALAFVALAGCSPQDSADSASASGEQAAAGSDSADASAAGSDSAAPAESASGKARPSNAGRLHVEGTQLVGENGQPAVLRGISTHGLAWFPQYVNADCFAQISNEWDANIVRLAMYTAENGGYCEGGDQAALRQLIDDGVNYATENDMYVIIDWHTLHDNDPNQHIEEAKVFWDETSAKYAGRKNVIYEICNEPNEGTSWDAVKSYAETILPIVRANDPEALVLLGTPNWCQYVNEAAANPIQGDPNLMYTLHFYAATHQQDLRDTATAALEAGLPLFVSEFGICDASGNGAIDEAQANAWMQLLDQWGISACMWNLSNKDESSSAIVASCDKTSGFTGEDLSQAGHWLLGMLGGEAAEAASDSGTSAAASATTAAATANAQFASGDFSCTLTVRNSWEAEGKSFTLYDAVVTNNGAACESWQVEIPFNEAFTLEDSWNGEYSTNGNTLQISNASYNASLAAGATATDVGFIVSGTATLKPQQ